MSLPLPLLHPVGTNEWAKEIRDWLYVNAERTVEADAMGIRIECPNCKTHLAMYYNESRQHTTLWISFRGDEGYASTNLTRVRATS